MHRWVVRLIIDDIIRVWPAVDDLLALLETLFAKLCVSILRLQVRYRTDCRFHSVHPPAPFLGLAGSGMTKSTTASRVTVAMNTAMNANTQTETETAGQESSKTRPPAPVAVRWLLGLALLYTLYFARSLLVPVVVALLLALLLSPAVELLKRLHIPRSLSALLLLCAIGGPLGLLAVELAEPAQKWATRLPELSAFMSEKLHALSAEPLAPAVAAAAPVTVQPKEKEKGFNLWGLFSSDDPAPEPAPAPIPEPLPAEKTGAEVVSDRIMAGGLEAALSMLVATPVIIAQVMTCLILFLFLLIFGPKLFEAAMRESEQNEGMARTMELVTNLRRHLSRYIVTVSAINTCLGAATALALWWLGVEDALLWGAVVAVLNFAPYIGPLLATGILCLAGLTQYGPEAAALLPALVYLILNLLEAQVVTPMVLGRNMRLNPLMVMLWLVVWGWLWGASGVLLAVPLLVCIKLVAEPLHIAPRWIRLLESEV